MGRELDKEKIIEYLREVKSLIPNVLEPDLPPSKLFPDVPEWHSYEFKVWQIGEKIRQILVKDNKLKEDEEIAEQIVRIAANRNVKRGRQSFIMLLGSKRYAKYASQIINHINDEFVYGHVLSTIIKMQVWDYKYEIEPLVSDKSAWIRNKAKKYIEKTKIHS
jgi:hypothetical protein